MKKNYHKLMLEELKHISNRPKLLLHVCCAICAATALKTLPDYFEVYIYFDNSNIHPIDEYNKRYAALVELIDKTNANVTLVESEYNPSAFYDFAYDLREEKEGGLRCHLCYEYRLKNTYNKAIEIGCEYYATAITQSPMKDVNIINEIGLKYNDKAKYLVSDFKKDNGLLYGNSICKEHDIYRQNYCGCTYSFRDV